jgi:hypothetical protein
MFMSKVLLKSIILFALLLCSIFTTYEVHQVDALSSFVTVTSTNSGGITKLSVSNSVDNTLEMVSFNLQINGGIFKSYNLENGWTGMKTSPTTLTFSAMNPLKPGQTAIFEIKTDQKTPTLTWRALDKNNVEIGSGNIGIQTPDGIQTLGGTGSTGGTQTSQTIRGVLDTSTFRIIPSTPAQGSHVRVVGLSFSPLANLDLYLATDKIGSLVSDQKGNFVTTFSIPDSAQSGSANFVIKDQLGNQKSFSTNIKVRQQGHEVIQNVPLTMNIDPVFHRGENKTISGTATPYSALTLSLFDSQGSEMTSLTEHSDKYGNYTVTHTVPSDFPFGIYTFTISDGKNQVSKKISVVTIHSVSALTSAQRYEPGETLFINGTSISNQVVNFAIADPSGHQIYSKDTNVTSNSLVSASYKLESSTMKGTYTITVTQGNDVTLLYFGVGEDPSPPITAKLDKLSYLTTDKPVITVTGPSSSTLNLVIVDPSSKQKFADVINLGPDGQSTYSFNLTSYTPGIYSAVVTHAVQKVQKDFAVGLSMSSGAITLQTVKDVYLPGDNIIIIGTANSNSLLQISLTDPNGILVKTLTIFSDKTGHFSSFDFKIPAVATPGIWKLDGTSGVNHEAKSLTIKSTKQGITVSLDKSSGIYTRGDLIKIFGTDAGITSEVRIKIGSNNTLVDTLPTSSTNRGDFSTYWQIPHNVNTGIYTIEASSITGTATISIRIQ